MALLSVLQWAAQERITPQAANKRIRVHGIPRHEGKIDPDEAARVFNDTLNIRQQERGTAAKRVEPVATGGADRRAFRRGALGAAGRRPEIQTAIDAVKLQERQLELKRKQGKVVDCDEVRSVVSAMISAAKNRLITIPDELCDKLAATADPVRCREMVEIRIHQALNELAEWPARPSREPPEAVV